MSSHFQTTCSPDCREKLSKSLFLVGEIGGNDYRKVKQWRNREEWCQQLFRPSFMVLKFYNNHLQQAIDELKQDYPNITLIYGDYYNAFLWLLQNAVNLGFDNNSLQKACCGIGGEYNYNIHKECGAPGVPVCIDPSTYISWDGVHLTQSAYSWLARWLIDDMLPKLNCQV